MMKNDELLKTYSEHKEFLDKLAEKEWIEKKVKAKISIVEKTKPEWVKK